MYFTILISCFIPNVLSYCHCGKYVRRNNHATSRIYQGTDVLEGRFPWQLLLMLEFASSWKSKSQYLGGAVLISRRHVLTASHNFYMEQKWNSYEILIIINECPSVSCHLITQKPDHQFWWNFACSLGICRPRFMYSFSSYYP